MKLLLTSIVTLLLLLVCTYETKAFDNPLTTTNNRFGIHFLDDGVDIDKAAQLVNGETGAWGYATVVIREDDRNSQKWQRIFDQFRKAKLIPIVRVATKSDKQNWIKPRSEEIESWVQFLSSLNWVIKNRYVVIFNEPNHAKEWGGEIDPEGYAAIFSAFQTQLYKASDDFFVLPAALDCAAATTAETLDCAAFWKRVYRADPGFFKSLVGWNSHSYPNPGFAGSPHATGKQSVRGYAWEMALLHKYGLASYIPIFITETGWKRSESLTQDMAAEFYTTAFATAWTDNRIVAITPFALKYLGDPFKDFSFLNDDGSTTQQFDAVAALPKVKGKPNQIEQFQNADTKIPNALFADSEYIFPIRLVNQGQSVWSAKDGYKISVTSTPPAQIWVDDIAPTTPFHLASVNVRIHTPPGVTTMDISFSLVKDNSVIGEPIKRTISLFSAPSLTLSAMGLLNTALPQDPFTLIVEDTTRSIHKEIDITFFDGHSKTLPLTDLVPYREYAFTLIRPYFVGKKRTLFITNTDSSVDFGTLLPIDFSNDGRLSLRDLLEGIKNPKRSWKLISGT